MLRRIVHSNTVQNSFRVTGSALWKKKGPCLKDSETSAVIAFPAKRGSVGDEAMVLALAAGLRRRGCKRIGLVAYSRDDRWTDFGSFDEVYPRPEGSPLRWWRFAQWLRNYDAFGVIGADVLDGCYSETKSIIRLRLAHFAHSVGLRTTLLGFSYRDDPSPGALRALQSAGPKVTLLCRDPVSQKRVASKTGLYPELVADLAFMLTPDFTTQRVGIVQNWARTVRGRGGVVIGLNCNAQVLGKRQQQDAPALAAALATAASRLGHQATNIHFLVIPHDSRGSTSDVEMAKQLWNSLDPAVRSRSYLVPETWRAAEIKAAASLLDLAITGRMHFGIACLGSGIPVASMTYQGKFEGLYDLFGLEGLTVPGERALESGALNDLLTTAYNRYPEVRSIVGERLPSILTLSERNIDALLGQPVNSYG